MLVTSGLATEAQGRLATEEDAFLPPSAAYPRASEVTAGKLLRRGGRVSTARLPQAPDTRNQGLGTCAIEVAPQKGVSAYVDDGPNGGRAAHVLDAARLYRLAL